MIYSKHLKNTTFWTPGTRQAGYMNSTDLSLTFKITPTSPSYIKTTF